MAGAKSLVQLILKKWGDDIAGAAKELEYDVGFPKSVANRIATGELPMDPASVARRADEQGYGDVLYHGSTHDIREFDGLLTNTENDMGQGTYLTDSIFDVSNNYAGEGPDLTNRIQSTAERIEDDLQSNWSHASDFWDQLPGGGSGKLADEIDALAEDGRYEEAAMMAAKAIRKGPTDGAIYPVRVKGDGVVSSRDRIESRDYHSEAADELGYDSSDLTDDQMDEVSELAFELEADDWQSVENSARSVASNYGADDVYIEPDSTWGEVRESLGSGEMYNEDGGPVGAGQALAEVLKGEGVKGYRDLESPSRFAGMASGKHTIMFPGSENQIRSVNAAFDPQYTGPNIMGGALAGAVGLGALSQSEDADASLAKLAARGYDLIEDVQDPKYNDSLFTVVDGAGNDVARAHMQDAEMWEGALNAADLEVLPPYRGRGIAGEMYDAIQEVTGKPVMPSPWLSMDGVRFWGKRNAPALRHMLEEDLFYDGDNRRKVKTFLEEWGLLEPGNKVKLRGFDRKY